MAKVSGIPYNVNTIGANTLQTKKLIASVDI